MPEKIVIAADIRTNRMVILVGKLNARKEIDILWFSESVNEGMTNGIISDSRKAVNSIQRALSKVRVSFDREDVRMICNYPGAVKFVKKKDALRIVISEADVALLKQKLYKQNPFPDELFICSTGGTYTIDDMDGILDPIGMATSTQIETDHVLVSVREANVHRWINCFAAAGLSMENFYPDCITAPHGVLYEEEIQEEAFTFVVIDTGSALTRITIVQNGRIENAALLRTGGNTITEAICVFTGLPFEQAETLKMRYGSFIPNEISDNRIIPITYPNGNKGIPVREKRLAEVIHKSAERLIDLAWKEARAHLAGGRLPDSLILTGRGIAKLPGIEELAKRVTGQRCRVGKAGIGLSPGSAAFAQLNSPEYATSIGLLRIGLRYE